MHKQLRLSSLLLSVSIALALAWHDWIRLIVWVLLWVAVNAIDLATGYGLQIPQENGCTKP